MRRHAEKIVRAEEKSGLSVYLDYGILMRLLADFADRREQSRSHDVSRHRILPRPDADERQDGRRSSINRPAIFSASTGYPDCPMKLSLYSSILADIDRSSARCRRQLPRQAAWTPTSFWRPSAISLAKGPRLRLEVPDDTRMETC